VIGFRETRNGYQVLSLNVRSELPVTGLSVVPSISRGPPSTTEQSLDVTVVSKFFCCDAISQLLCSVCQHAGVIYLYILGMPACIVCLMIKRSNTGIGMTSSYHYCRPYLARVWPIRGLYSGLRQEVQAIKLLASSLSWIGILCASVLLTSWHSTCTLCAHLL